MEGDAPLSDAIVEQASQWLVKLWSGDATAQDHEECLQWRAAHADHERAWQRLDLLQRKFEVVPRGIASRTLKNATSPGRRRVLKGFGGLLLAGAATHVASRTQLWQRYAADYRTGVGESQTIELADRSTVKMNTGSALDVTFDDQQRHLLLRAGEILVNTSSDSARRPFIVSTAQGSIQAMGTRFTVRQTDDGVSNVGVIEGAVDIRPRLSIERPIRLQPGQQLSFSDTASYGTTPISDGANAWIDGMLKVTRMRLDVFVQELSRYRSGLLTCDESVADQLLTGVYLLPDTDRILASVAMALPVKVIYRNRYWVKVTAG